VRRLARRSLSIFALRWLRSWGYRGQRPGILYGAALVLLAAASIGAAVWTHSQFQGFDRLPAQFRPPIVAAIVLFLFISGGLMLLLTESIRLSGSRLGAVLGTLPLTTREIRLLLWLPVFTASLAMQVLLFVPAVAAFLTLRFPLDQSLLASLLALFSGYGLATVLVVLIRRTLGSSRWASVQYPAMLVAWMGLSGLEVWQTIVDFGGRGSGVWSAVLLAPWISREAGQGRIASWQFGAVIIGVLATVALLLWSGGRSPEVNYPRVAWRWSSRWKPSLVTLELTRMLRSPYLVANLIGGEIVSLGLALALWKLPPILRGYLFVAVLSTMMLFCALPLVLIRGLTRAKWPPALLLGYRPTAWTMAQVWVGVGLALCLAVPPLTLSGWLLGSAGAVLVPALPLLALSCGLAIYVGWLTPLGADDPLGQAVSTFSLFLSIQLLELLLDHLFHARTAAWAMSLLIIGAFGIAGATLLERRRWGQLLGSVSQHA
jgi:hypothetical protein